MARNRQRAKQRQQQRREERLKERREQGGDGAPPAPRAEPEGPADPGDIGRIAAETGAPPQNLGRSDLTDASPPPEPILDDEQVDELFLEDEDFEVDQDELADAEEAEGYAPRGRRGGDEATVAGRAPASGERTRARGGARVVAFLRASWAELQRVQWPDRRQLTQLTAIVLVFIVIMGSYLGILDAIFSRLIQDII